MKALWIVYDIVLDETVAGLLDEFKVVGFTRWPRLAGRGPRSGARLDDHVWPGANAAVMTVQDDDLVAFHDIAPWAPVHFLLVPKAHIASMAQVLSLIHI